MAARLRTLRSATLFLLQINDQLVPSVLGYTDTAQSWSCTNAVLGPGRSVKVRQRAWPLFLTRSILIAISIRLLIE